MGKLKMSYDLTLVTDGDCICGNIDDHPDAEGCQGGKSGSRGTYPLQHELRLEGKHRSSEHLQELRFLNIYTLWNCRAGNGHDRVRYAFQVTDCQAEIN